MKKKFKLKLGKTEKSVLQKNPLTKMFKEANQRIKNETLPHPKGGGILKENGKNKHNKRKSNIY